MMLASQPLRPLASFPMVEVEAASLLGSDVLLGQGPHPAWIPPLKHSQGSMESTPSAGTSWRVCVLTQRSLTNRGSHHSSPCLEVTLYLGCPWSSLWRPLGQMTYPQTERPHLRSQKFLDFPNKAVSNSM